MVPGYRYGQSAAGKRIESAGIAFQAEQARRAQEALRQQPPPLTGRTKLFTAPIELESGPLAKLAPASCRHIIRQVAAKYRLTVTEILSEARHVEVSRPRQEAMYRCVAETNLSLIRIGKEFGGRDHSTIYYGTLYHCGRNGIKPPRGMAKSVKYQRWIEARKASA